MDKLEMMRRFITDDVPRIAIIRADQQRPFMSQVMAIYNKRYSPPLDYDTVHTYSTIATRFKLFTTYLDRISKSLDQYVTEYMACMVKVIYDIIHKKKSAQDYINDLEKYNREILLKKEKDDKNAKQRAEKEQKNAEQRAEKERQRLIMEETAKHAKSAKQQDIDIEHTLSMFSKMSLNPQQSSSTSPTSSTSSPLPSANSYYIPAEPAQIPPALSPSIVYQQHLDDRVNTVVIDDQEHHLWLSNPVNNIAHRKQSVMLREVTPYVYRDKKPLKMYDIANAWYTLGFGAVKKASSNPNNHEEYENYILSCQPIGQYINENHIHIYRYEKDGVDVRGQAKVKFYNKNKKTKKWKWDHVMIAEHLIDYKKEDKFKVAEFLYHIAYDVLRQFGVEQCQPITSPVRDQRLTEYGGPVEPYKFAPQSHKRSPQRRKRSPRTRKRTPQTHKRSPRTHKRSPRTHKRSPRTRKRSQKSRRK
jgi:hypothetical protein